MLIIPAIDIMDGKCVRLYRGQKSRRKDYHDNPSEVAKQWEEEGATLLHVVDLDGAFTGKPGNYRTIEKLIDSVQIQVEVGGGIREEETIENYLEMGAERVVLGTRAVKEPHFLEDACKNYGERIILSIDAKNGKVAVEGWKRLSRRNAIEFARGFEYLGLGGIIYTDLLRDGTLKGPNIEAIRNFASAVQVSVIASGGISSMDDIAKLVALEEAGLQGIIIGRALYEGMINLQEAIRRFQ